jgi:hypothetical protein
MGGQCPIGIASPVHPRLPEVPHKQLVLHAHVSGNRAVSRMCRRDSWPIGPGGLPQGSRQRTGGPRGLPNGGRGVSGRAHLTPDLLFPPGLPMVASRPRKSP